MTKTSLLLVGIKLLASLTFLLQVLLVFIFGSMTDCEGAFYGYPLMPIGVKLWVFVVSIAMLVRTLLMLRIEPYEYAATVLFNILLLVFSFYCMGLYLLQM